MCMCTQANFTLLSRISRVLVLPVSLSFWAYNYVQSLSPINISVMSIGSRFLLKDLCLINVSVSRKFSVHIGHHKIPIIRQVMGGSVNQALIEYFLQTDYLRSSKNDSISVKARISLETTQLLGY